MPNVGPTVRSLDERIDDLERSVHSEITSLKLAIQEHGRQSDQKLNDFQKELAHFQGSIITSLNIAKWIGSVAALVIISLIGFGWQFSAANGRLEQKVSGLEQRMDKLEQRMDKLEQRMDKLEQRMEQQSKQIEEVTRILKEKLPDKKD